MKKINEMTLKEKLGQLIVAGFDGYEYDCHMKTLIEEYKVGNVILFQRNIKDGKQLFDLNKKFHEEIKKNTGIIPFIAIDQEGGMVTRIMSDATFAPGAMTIAATNNKNNAFEVGKIMAREMLSYGINYDLAPSLDINNNPNNSVIGVRSYSSDKEKVSEYGNLFIKGLEEEGILSTAKHFPGHGDTMVDSHLALPRIKHEKERLDEVELYPFKKAIKNNVSSIMSAHIIFDAYENNLLPATLSKNILTGLLRDGLGFNGLIISDCMEMKAISETYTTEKGAAIGIKAGLDLVCISHTLERQIGALKEIEKMIENGEIKEEEIDKKVERILKYKEKTIDALNKYFYGKTFDDIKIVVNDKESKDKCFDIVRKSLTIYKGELIKQNKKTLVLAPLPFASTIVEDKISSRNLLLEIKKECFGVDALNISLDPKDDEIESVVKKIDGYEQVLIASYNAIFYNGQVKLVDRLSKLKIDLYTISLRLPYDTVLYENVKNSAILYEYTPSSIKVICEMLKGEVEAKGEIPVALNEKTKIGASIYAGLDDYSLEDNLNYLNVLKECNIDRCFISHHMMEKNDNFQNEFKKILEKAKENNIKIILDVSKKSFEELKDIDDIFSLRLDYGFNLQEIVDLSNSKPYYIELNLSTTPIEKMEKMIEMGLNLNNIRLSHNFYPKAYTALSLDKVKEINEKYKKYGLKIMAYIPSHSQRRMPLYEGLPTVETHRNAPLIEALQELKGAYCDEVFFGDSFASKEELKCATSFDYSVITVPILVNKNITKEEKEHLLKVQRNRIDESEYFKRSSLRCEIKKGIITKRQKGDITIDNVLFKRYQGEVSIMKKDLEKDERVNVVGRICSSFDLIDMIKPGSKFRFVIIGEY